ncbi:hypothetical protein AN963_12130 [Brevibacillus choshinensis]|uniref:N-acetyltransferase domain-containing protein n=1 Tax=Brevibacillus choshinensis TaxID=54911 RepID=A0ABR5N569_BRECH|nr:GNAT family N-acetyltransferase [Brevibacillus choshinensis]KQL45788.1 hypothetical protein AN963_12130 [Brevibacillus choshinensis]
MNAQLEERSINAWPALETMVDDGWLLRFADGYTKRANSVYPLYPPTITNLEQKIAACERHYESKGLPTIFKLTPYSQPAGLDALLEQKGYALHADTSVQTVSLERMASPSIQTVQVYEACTDEWVNAFCRLSRKDDEEKRTMSQTLRKIIPSTCYAALVHEGKVVACGLGVLEREYIGLYDIVTDPSYRKRGFGEQLVLSILQWGVEHGAKHSYLQVVQDNTPALRLYEKLGYKEVYPYWYRIRDVGVDRSSST